MTRHARADLTLGVIPPFSKSPAVTRSRLQSPTVTNTLPALSSSPDQPPHGTWPTVPTEVVSPALYIQLQFCTRNHRYPPIVIISYLVMVRAPPPTPWFSFKTGGGVKKPIISETPWAHECSPHQQIPDDELNRERAQMMMETRRTGRTVFTVIGGSPPGRTLQKALHQAELNIPRNGSRRSFRSIVDML
ncbi:hypothetical protein BS47DRAFT_1387734 [Hydnum rufescens UP504]|uniref:Uncharacterized protein n=1 Tax=Hydnum rufescens UP504 TaxID=1448309 RepID=A0A9P6E275_9AGAM|nr:hypothetical protein BS47DRAFT_1387734 [Hydnum rufescens UP504]